jgi:hypothetical protein
MILLEPVPSAYREPRRCHNQKIDTKLAGLIKLSKPSDAPVVSVRMTHRDVRRRPALPGAVKREGPSILAVECKGR